MLTKPSENAHYAVARAFSFRGLARACDPELRKVVLPQQTQCASANRCGLRALLGAPGPEPQGTASLVWRASSRAAGALLRQVGPEMFRALHEAPGATLGGAGVRANCSRPLPSPSDQGH